MSTADFPAAEPGLPYGFSLSSFLAPVMSWLGHEINETAFMSVALTAAMSSFGNKAKILQAIIDHADSIFPDPITRPEIVKALVALKGSVLLKAGA